MRFRFAEAFVHTEVGPLSLNDHAGEYVIMKKVKRDGNRLDFPKLSENGSCVGLRLRLQRRSGYKAWVES